MSLSHAPGSAQSIEDAVPSRASEYCGAVGRLRRFHIAEGTEQAEIGSSKANIRARFETAIRIGFDLCEKHFPDRRLTRLIEPVRLPRADIARREPAVISESGSATRRRVRAAQKVAAARS
jgi:hypothetical protein